MHTPDAEVEIDEALVSALVEAQHPSLAGEVRLIANGWDNVMFRLGDVLTVRLPRRAVAVPLVEKELRWLPSIALRMPVAVPTPVAVGLPSPAYPWPWYISHWFEGVAADRLVAGERDALAQDLAAALAALHVPAPDDAPVNPVRGVPLAGRDAVVRARIATHPDHVALLEAWERGISARAYDGPPLWIHGDVDPGNAITAGDRLVALIDFGDLGAGDPATDLSAAWTFFGPEGRAVFMDALDYDTATWIRAEAWAAAITALLDH